jgi:putative membrane protein
VQGPLPYCGSPPHPGELLSRFNIDPLLILILAALCLWQLWAIRASALSRGRTWIALAVTGWGIAAAAFLSPLCALSVSLFSARVGQHMILILAAAPLIALGWPAQRRSGGALQLWLSTAIFFVALWYWHMPAPYDATFASVPMYWSMHVTLFGSSILLWHSLLNHTRQHTAQALAAGLLTFLQMGLLGAVLTFADRPMFSSHLLTAPLWGLSALQDQQLGGALMWVPGIALFSWIALRSIARLWLSLEQARPA